jgi:hypothetical protein
MADNPQGETQPTRRGDRRGNDRRGNDRRAPAPLWRRPWALVLYGVAGTLLVVLLLSRSRPPATPVAGEDEVVMAPPRAPATEAPRSMEPAVAAEDAHRQADHQRLMAEGDAATGRLVRVELYCSGINQISLRAVDRVESAVSELADATNRVPAAECKWGPQRADDPRADVLLLVPPALAEEFASAPVVDDGFVRRRRVQGVAEWIGRSDALALRTALVLRQRG